MEMSDSRLEKLIQLLEQQPADLFLQYALAMEYLGLADIQQAELNFRKVLAHDETYIPAYYQLGKICEGEGKDQEAIRLFEKGLAYAQQKKDLKTMNEFRTALDELLF
jgi:Tfp pilus assembly protein PilF